MHRGFSTPLVIAIMAFAVISFLFLIDTAINPDGSKKNSTNKNTNQVACTLEAKLCPDGSAVGRTGPDCKFTLCPGENEIDSFVECEAAGYPVMESYPRQCSANNQTFVEVITNVNISTNTNSTSDPTAGWKTYMNTALGFTAKYPSDWIVTGCDDIYVSFDTKRHVCDSEYVSGFNVKKINPDEIPAQIEATKKQWSNVSDESISIGGRDARRISGVGDLFEDPGWYQDIVYVTINGHTLSFHYLEKPGDAPPNLSNFNTFLSSIAFAS